MMSRSRYTGFLPSVGMALGVVLSTLCAFPCCGAVVLTLHNLNVPLLDTDDSSLLDGSVVQVIYTGAGGTIDGPNVFGLPGGDDVLATQLNNPTSTGEGIGPADTGTLIQSGMTFDDALVGLNAYVRYWNGFSLPSATHYGESAMFTLPAGDFFGLATVDFMPAAGNNKVDTLFSAATPTLSPEPSSMLYFMFFAIIMLIRRQVTRAWETGSFLIPILCLPTLGLLLFVPDSAQAQLPSRLDIVVQLPLLDATGAILPGSNPEAGRLGGVAIDGALVQVLAAGVDGQAGLPQADGTPSGDDRLLFTGKIGEGIAPNIVNSGRFSLVVDPGPSDGSKVFARLFNRPTLSESTHWGQSALFEVKGSKVFFADQWGLWGTTMPKQGILPGADTDRDGATDLEEFAANTNADDAQDIFQVMALPSGARRQFRFAAKPGRRYILERSTNTLLESMQWTGIGEVQGPYLSAQSIEVEDPEPIANAATFYRLRVLSP